MYDEFKIKSRRYFGIFLIVFGIAGIIFPILPGWWVALLGLELIGWKLVIDRKKPWKEIISFKSKKDISESKETADKEN